MLPPAILNLLYLAMAIVATILCYRYLRRWWNNRRSASPAESRRNEQGWSLAKTDSPLESSLNQDSTPLESPVRIDSKSSFHEAAELPLRDVSILKSAASSSTAGTSTAGGSTVGGSTQRARWDNERLFVNSSSTYADDLRGLPRVLADDLPGAASPKEMAFGSLTPALASLLPEMGNRKDDIRSDLYAAGYYQPQALANFSAIRYIAMVVPMILCGVLLLVVPPRLEPIVIGAIVLMPILGWSLPRLYLRNKARDRRNEIEKAMPDLLDMLNMCVSQGMTVPTALERIQVEMKGAYPALEQELRIISEQSRIGSPEVALKNFSQRVDVPEVHSFTSLLMQTSRMGTSVSGALAEYAGTMRESLKQRAEEKGNRATFRLLFPTVLCLMPAVYLFLMGPAVIELSRFFYEGGREGLDTGSQAIQRINNNNRARVDGQPGQQPF